MKHCWVRIGIVTAQANCCCFQVLVKFHLTLLLNYSSELISFRRQLSVWGSCISLWLSRQSSSCCLPSSCTHWVVSSWAHHTPKLRMVEGHLLPRPCDLLAGKPLLSFDAFGSSIILASAVGIFAIEVYALSLRMTYFICEIVIKHRVAVHSRKSCFA